MEIERKKAVNAVIVGVMVAVVPFVFWRTFLRQLPLVGSGEATLSERFEESDPSTPTPTPDGGAKLRELLAYPATALTLDKGTGMLRMYEEETGRVFEVNPGTLKVFTVSDNRLDDFVVASAAAEVARDPPTDLVLRRVGVLVEQVLGAHDHARSAVAALQTVFLPEALLQRMELAISSERLDRLDGRSVGLHREDGAALDGSAVEQHGAGAAAGRVATDVGAR